MSVENPEGLYDRRSLVRAMKAILEEGVLPEKLPGVITAENIQRFLSEPGSLPEEGKKAILKIAKHPDILEKLPHLDVEVYQEIPKPLEGFSAEKRELLETRMTREEMKEFFAVFVRILRNKKSPVGATFAAGKHYLGSSLQTDQTRDRIFPDREQYRTEIARRTGIRSPRLESHTADIETSGGLMYLDSQLAPKQLKFFDELPPDQIMALLSVGNLESGFWDNQGLKFGQRGRLKNIEDGMWLEDSLTKTGSLTPVGMKVTDVYFSPQDTQRKRKENPFFDKKGQLAKGYAVNPYRCIRVEVPNKVPGAYPDSRWKALNLVVMMADTQEIYDGINAPDDEQKRKGIHHPYFQLLRAMKTNPAFLVEALRQVYPNVFTINQPDQKFYFDPNNFESIPVYLYGDEFGKGVAIKHTPAAFKYERGEE